jgi:hypothetical protein
MAFSLPSTNTINFGLAPAHFRINLLTKFAFLVHGNCLHYQLHTTSVANTILLGTMLAKMPPFPISTFKAMLVKEAHGNDEVGTCSIKQSKAWMARKDRTRG